MSSMSSADVVSGHVHANGVRLYYELTGEGEPLVLVHGSWGSARVWARVVPALATSYRVLAYDRRGHSRSARSASPGSAAEDARDLAALIDSLELAPVHVCGGSFGGSIALRLAAARPDLVRSLVAHEPPLFDLVDTPERRAAIDRLAGSFDRVAELIEAGEAEKGARVFWRGGRSRPWSVAAAPGRDS